MLIFLLFQACAVQKRRELNHFMDDWLHRDLLDRQFTGILLFNPASGDTLYRHNSQKYFTPASNTKLFTLYACLQLLPDRIPALRYLFLQDTLYIEGTGDPSQLHPYFRDSTVQKFISKYPLVALNSTNFQEEAQGPGWAWDDYDWYYSAERSALPLYGNVVEVYMGDSLEVAPEFFRDSVHLIRYPHNRLQGSNTFFFDPDGGDTLQIPVRTDSTLTRRLLEQATGKRILHAGKMPAGELQTLYSIPADSLYRRMIQESDNFLAEQLLLLVSGTRSDTLNSQRARDLVLDEYLKDLPQEPVWVDGSGLSRYNLFSPEDMVYLLNRMYREIPEQRLLSYFAAGGVSGTLREWYTGQEKPYVFAKTGSLSNNYCVSGYLRTRSGKLLIFSFMNNHFTMPVARLKEAMQNVFEYIRDTY